MFCSNCGKEIPVNSLFCPFCGKSASSSVSSETTAAQPTQVSQCQPKPVEPTPPLNQPPVPLHSSLSNSGVQTFPQKNIWERFKENRHVDEPNLMQIDFNNPDTLAALQQIMGSGYYYYLPRFQQIQTYGKSSYNWYSMLLGIVHAAYRNVWRELVDKMKWVLLVVGILWILPLIVAFVSSPVAVLSAISLAYFATMAIGITQIVVASSFDKIYMRHIQKKLLANDFTPDEDMGRGFKIALASTGITWIVVCIGMSSLAIL